MEPAIADKSVPREVNALFSNQPVVLRETGRAMMPIGGIAVLVAFLHKLNFAGKARQHKPFCFTTLNQ